MIDKAVANLRPGASWILEGWEYSGLKWHDTVQIKPTEAEVATEVARLQADYDSKEYQRLRENKYPDIKSQLDMLWHAIDNGTLNKTSDFYTAIKAVKDAHPKE